MIPEFMPDEKRPLQVLNGTTVEPTCFQNLVVGMPMYSDDCDVGFERETDVWSLCNHARQGCPTEYELHRLWHYDSYGDAQYGDGWGTTTLQIRDVWIMMRNISLKSVMIVCCRIPVYSNVPFVNVA